MRVRELIDLLERFDPESTVQVCTDFNGLVVQSYSTLVLGGTEHGPQIHLMPDLRGQTVYVGCDIGQFVHPVPPDPFRLEIDLGQYDNPNDQAHVYDYYIVHRQLDIPLHDPDFDYENWIPPRTSDGDYNRHIAEILKEKLSGE